MPTVGVLLSGCGVYDGAEIHESVLTLLALDQAGARIMCCAPNIEQSAVIDHRTQRPVSETRNVLTEAARIARGEIRDLAEVRADDLQALIVPGGYGAAINLSNFAQAGAECSVNPDVERLVGECLAARKPVGALCIAPTVVARIAAKRGISVRLTIGNDPDTAEKIAGMGCTHEQQPATGITVDSDHMVVSTPAYMVGSGPAEVFEGIRKLVGKVLEMV
jgi:enhancing lycopene biosynthesis protein 2